MDTLSEIPSSAKKRRVSWALPAVAGFVLLLMVFFIIQVARMPHLAMPPPQKTIEESQNIAGKARP